MSSIEPLNAGAFQWTTQEPLQIRPFKPIYHITMGKKSTTYLDLFQADDLL